MQRLKVASTVSRVLQHWNQDKPCAVISAYRTEYSDSENLHRHAELLKKIRDLRLGYIELDAHWQQPATADKLAQKSYERSFCIPGMEIEDAIELGGQFEQYSVLAKDDGQMVEARCGDGKIVSRYTNTEVSAEDFIGAFSKLRIGTNNAQNIRMKLSYFAELGKKNILPVASTKSLDYVNHIFVGSDNA
jgi:hypothetical protein